MNRRPCGVNRVVDNGQVPRDSPLVVLAMDTVVPTSKDNVVANHRVGSGLDRMGLTAPDDVAFDDVRRFATGAIDQNSRVLRVVDHVVADDVVVATLLDFNAIALLDVGAGEVMDVVFFDDAVDEQALRIVGSQIKCLADTGRVVDVIVAQNDANIAIAWVVRCHGTVTDMVDMAILNREMLDVTPSVLKHSDPRAAASYLETLESYMLAPLNHEDISEVIASTIACFEHNSCPLGSTDHDRLNCRTMLAN